MEQYYFDYLKTDFLKDCKKLRVKEDSIEDVKQELYIRYIVKSEKYSKKLFNNKNRYFKKVCQTILVDIVRDTLRKQALDKRIKDFMTEKDINYFDSYAVLEVKDILSAADLPDLERAVFSCHALGQSFESIKNVVKTDKTEKALKHIYYRTVTKLKSIAD